MFEFSPSELVFQDVLLNKTYIQKVVITNSLKATVEATIRPGSSDRYSVCPSDVLLKAGESIPVEVKLRITRFAHKQRAIEGQRDVFHVKTPYFDQKFSSTFFLSPSFDEAVKPKDDRPSTASSPFKQAKTAMQPAKHASALSSSVPDLPTSASFKAGPPEAPGRDMRKSVSFSEHARPRTAGDAPTARTPASGLRSSFADNTGMEEYSSTHTAFESFRAQMEADRAEVSIQLGKLGLAAPTVAGSPIAAHRTWEMAVLAPEATPTASPARRADTGRVKALSHERDQLASDNQRLSEHVGELTAQLDSARKELKAMAKVQVELQARQPDVERLIAAALQREQAAQEDRNRKALELLLKKDEQIKRLEAHNRDLQTDVSSLQDSLRSALMKLDAASKSAVDLAQSRELLRAQLEREASSAAATQASLRGEVAALKAEVGDAAACRKECRLLQERADDSERRLKGLQAELDAAQQAQATAVQEAGRLANNISAYEEHLQGLEGSAAVQDTSTQKQKEMYAQQVADLQRHVAGLQETLSAVTAPGSSDRASTGVAPTALFERIKALEDANSRLEHALRSDSGAKVNVYELQSIKDALARRDQHVAELQAELAVLRKSTAEQPGLEGSAAEANLDDFRIRMLTEQVEAQNSHLAELQDKLAHLEAVHAVAQESAMQSEHELQHARRLLAEMEEVGQQYAADAEAARATSVKLNSRITELMLSEQAAAAEATTCRQDMERLSDLHRRDLQAMEGRMQQLQGELQATMADAARARAGLPDGGVSGQPAASIHATKHAEALQMGMEDAETAIAVLQAKLVGAERAAEDAKVELEAVKRDADDATRELQHQVRLASEDGSTRLQHLEETVKRMSGRSALQSDVADLSYQLSNSRRVENMTRANLELAEQQMSEQQAKIAKLEFQLRVVSKELQGVKELASSHGVQVASPGKQEVLDQLQAACQPLLHTLSRPEKQQQLVVTLADRAERAEAEAGRLKAQVDRLQAAARQAPTPPGTSAAAFGMGMQSELQLLREQKEVVCLEAERLRQELMEASREVAVAQARLASREQDIRDKEDACLRKSLQTVSAHAHEVAAANKRAAEAQRRADQADSARIAAEEQARQATVWLAKLKAEVEARSTEVRRVQEHANKELAAASSAAASSKRECEKATLEAEERKIQASILMDTVETLQVGSGGEAAQRVLTLTAQLVTARTREVMLERRAAELLAEVEARDKEACKLHQQLDRVLQDASEKDADLATSHSSLGSMRQALEDLQGDLRARGDMVQAASGELDEARHVLAATQAELEGLKAAMLAAQGRHMEQLARERAEAGKAVNLAKEQVIMLSVNSGDDIVAMHTAKLSHSIEAVLAWAMQPAGMSQSDPAVAVLQRMKAILLEADQQRAKAEVEARIAKAEAAGLAHRAAVVEAALVRRTSEWEAAKLQHHLLQKSTNRHGSVASSHSQQLAALQEQRIGSLNSQLTDATSKLVAASVSEAALKSKLAAHKARGNALQRRLKVSEAEGKELMARLAAAQLEAAGICEEDGSACSGEGTLQRRDAAIRGYFEGHLLQLARSEDSREQLKSLAAELCALKISESLLLGKLAAANKRADAATMLGQALQQALEAATEQLEACHMADATQSSSVLELSQLTASVAAKSLQIQRLQEQLLLSRQNAEAKELSLKEVEAQLAAGQSAPQQSQQDTVEQPQEQRASLTAAAGRERAEQAQQLQQLRQLVAELKQAAKREAELHGDEVERLKQQAAKEASALKDTAVRDILQSHVPTSELLKAETQVVQLEAANERLQQEAGILQQRLRELEVQVAGLQDVEEVTHAAMRSLEGTLARIEKVAVVTSSGTIRTRSPIPQGPRRTSSSGAAASRRASGHGGENEAGEMSLSALSQELVKARLAEADAQRKLRVASRAEVELRQRLTQRDERISELKEELESKSRFSEDLRRRLSSSGAGPSGRRDTTPARAAPVARSLSAPPGEDLRGGATGARERQGAGVLSRLGGRGPKALQSSAAAGVGDVDGETATDVERRYLTTQVAQLRIELARREAEVEQLEGAVAAARAVQTEPPDMRLLSKKALKVEQLEQQLASSHSELQAAISSTQAALKLLGASGSPAAEPGGWGADAAAEVDQWGGEAPRLKDLIVELAAHARACQAELHSVRKLLPSAPQAAAQAGLAQQAEQLLAAKQQLQARCTQLQAQLDRVDKERRHQAQSAPALPKTALGLCKMLEQNLDAMQRAGSCAAPMQPSMQVLLSELDGARSLLSSISTELVACCHPAGGTPPEAIQQELHRQHQRAEKWKGQCKRMRRELAAVHAAVAAQGQPTGAGADRAAGGQQPLLAPGELQRIASLSEPVHLLGLQAGLQAALARATTLEQELAAAKAALGQEQHERAASLASMRNTLAALSTSGVTEERLKEELIRALEANSRTTSSLAAAHSKLDKYQAHAHAARTASQVSGLQSTAAVAQLQAGLIEMQRKVDEAEGRALQLQHVLTARLDELCAYLEHLESGPPRQLAAGLDAVQQAADLLGQELQQLHATFPGITKAQLQGVLLKCRKYQQAAKDLQAQLASMSASADQERQRLQAELEGAQREAGTRAEEAAQLQRKVADMQAFSEAERQRLVERHVGQLREVEMRMEAERRELRQQANARAEAAMAAGESRGAAGAGARVAEMEAQAAHSMAGMEEMRARCAAELAGLQLEFKRYQQQKAAEIGALEQRLVACLQLPFQGPLESLQGQAAAASRSNRKAAKNVKKKVVKPAAANRQPLYMPHFPPYHAAEDPSYPQQQQQQQPASPASEAWRGPAGALAAAREAEQVEAARREAHFEQLQRVRAEAAAGQLQEEVERLRARLKGSQLELKQLQEASQSSSRSASDHATAKEECERLQEELATCREALKAARADSTRRQRLLQQFQARLGSEGSDQYPATVMEAQRVRQEAAETQLQQAKAGLDRKSALVKELRKQVDDLKAALKEASAGGLQDKLAISEARCAQLQASMQRKEAALKEARDRADQSQSLAAAAVATTAAAGQQAVKQQGSQEVERQARLLSRLRADVQRKDALLKGAQNELQRERERLQAEVEAAQEACKREARSARQAANDAATLRGRAEQLVEAMGRVVRLVMRCCQGMRSAAAAAAVRAQSASGQLPLDGVGADAIAQMVDMSATEVADLLGPQRVGGAASEEALLAMGARAQALILQIEVALASGLASKVEKEALPGRDSFARQSNSALGLQQQWEGGATALLLQSLEAGVQLCEKGLDAALGADLLAS